MTDRLADNIRRIVGIGGKKAKVIGDAEERETLNGNRGVSYAQPGTSGVRSTTVASGQAGQNPGAGSAVSNTLGFSGGYGNRPTGNGSFTNADDPSKAILDGSGNGNTVEDILDGKGSKLIDPSIKDGTTDNDVYGEAIDSISGIKDCATGRDICIQLKNGLVPPDGWDDINSPPASYYDGNITISPAGDSIFQWQQGVRWVTIISGTATEVSFPNASAGIDYIKNNTLSPDPTITSIAWDSGLGDGAFRILSNSGAYQELLTIDTCTVGVDSNCPLLKPKDSELFLPKLPSTGCHQVSWENGKLKSGRTADADKVPRLSSSTVSKLEYCFGVGRFGVFEPAINGGFMLYETSSAGGAFTGVGTLYNARGQAVKSLTSANDVIRSKP